MPHPPNRHSRIGGNLVSARPSPSLEPDEEPVEGDVGRSGGADPAALRRVVNCNAYVGDDDPATKLATTFGNPGGVMGTAEQALEIVARCREAGVDTFHVQFQNEIIAEQIPAFGEMVIAKAE